LSRRRRLGACLRWCHGRRGRRCRVERRVLCGKVERDVRGGENVVVHAERPDGEFAAIQRERRQPSTDVQVGRPRNVQRLHGEADGNAVDIHGFVAIRAARVRHCNMMPLAERWRVACVRWRCRDVCSSSRAEAEVTRPMTTCTIGGGPDAEVRGRASCASARPPLKHGILRL